ncbi:helix-turn-helix transcriptional regulator [Rhodanobacter sp. 7MK24]|uniref:helix-turn-helix domain-containing protein n=1 Tax=Rhodanobacter sp. 7MK24 TaxID=2775922 RepID=UPI00177D02CE|nr:AraC family transcriptional regulator [Rhodanobacter sp. 7MK24]MBD8879262.1 helix-turn-helix transcriptional regulator [Rhodanobacter sp. 7MK24]
MDIAFWVFVYIAAAVQAALLALALWRRSANREANRLLAAWVALAGIDLAVKAAYWHMLSPEWFRAYRFVALFPFLYGSLFFLYVRALTRGLGFRWRDVRHLLGFVAMLLVTGHVLLASTARLQAMSASWIAGERSIGHWFDIALFLYSLSYVVAALVQVHRYRRRLRERRSDADRLSLRWIDTMAACQVVIWCIAIVQALVELPILNYGLLFGAIAGWICVVGWFSLGQPPLAVEPEVEPVGDETVAPATTSEPEDMRYDVVQARLASLMDGGDPLYMEPALTIGQVAKRSGYPEYLVSAVINRRFGGTFWDYINRLRVEAARACLADAGDTRSILDIAYACGFTSKSTFNAAFKRQVDDTPSSYRKAARPLKAAADGAERR